MRERPNINGPLLWSAAFLGAVVILALFLVPALLKAAFMTGGDDAELSATFTKLITDHDQAQQTYADRFNGRSIFFKPPQPRRVVTTPPPEPRPVDSRPRVTTPPPEPPKPVRPPYAGPAVRAFIGDEVWFHGDLRIRLGEPPQNGIEVLSFDLPWSVKVAYGGWEYDVPIFERSMDAVLVPEKPAPPGPAKAPSSVPGLIEAPPGAAVPAPPASAAVPLAAGDGAASADGKPAADSDSKSGSESTPEKDAATAEKPAGDEERTAGGAGRGEDDAGAGAEGPAGEEARTAGGDGENEDDAGAEAEKPAADPEKTATAEHL